MYWKRILETEYSVIHAFSHVVLHTNREKNVTVKPWAMPSTMPFVEPSKNRNTACAPNFSFLYITGIHQTYLHTVCILRLTLERAQISIPHQFKAMKTPLAGHLVCSRHPRASFNALTWLVCTCCSFVPEQYDFSFFLPDCIWAGGCTELIMV